MSGPDAGGKNGTTYTQPDGATDPLPPSVAAVIANHKHVARLFAGKAKGIGADGNVLGKDTSPESYDFSFVVALIKHGVRDPDVLAAALRRRPDGHAVERGDAYLADVIARGLAIADQAANAGDGHEFAVEEVTVFDGDETKFTLSIKIGDRSAAVTMLVGELLNARQFKARCFEKLRLIVRIPPRWHQTVELWMESAKVVTPPSDIKRKGAIRIAVERALTKMPPCDSFEDLRDGRGVIAERRGRKVLLFEIDAVLLLLRSQDLAPTREEVWEALTAIGATHARHTVTTARDGKRKSPTCWRVPAPKELVDVVVPAPARPTPTSPPEGVF